MVKTTSYEQAYFAILDFGYNKDRFPKTDIKNLGIPGSLVEEVFKEMESLGILRVERDVYVFNRDAVDKGDIIERAKNALKTLSKKPATPAKPRERPKYRGE